VVEVCGFPGMWQSSQRTGPIEDSRSINELTIPIRHCRHSWIEIFPFFRENISFKLISSYIQLTP